MKMFRIVVLVPIALCLSVALAGAADAKGSKAGEELFKKHCSACHPEGGNIINPQKTLQKKDRIANNIKSAKDIIGKMRKPGPGMTEFDKKAVSDKEAKEIAEYILKTF
jgi:cytochrome c6